MLGIVPLGFYFMDRLAIIDLFIEKIGNTDHIPTCEHAVLYVSDFLLRGKRNLFRLILLTSLC